MKFGNPFETKPTKATEEVLTPEEEEALQEMCETATPEMSQLVGGGFCAEMEGVINEEITAYIEKLEASLNDEMGQLFKALGLGRVTIKVTSHTDITFEDEGE